MRARVPRDRESLRSLGWLVPTWPNGIDQRPAIVGSIVRTVPHSNGQAKAGKVASFIAVKQD